MLSAPYAIDIPIHADEDGTLRISATRVTLESVISEFQAGASPETLAEQFSALTQTEIYHVISYYLANQEAVTEYMASQRHKSQLARAEWEATMPAPTSKAELTARLAKQPR